MQVYNCLIVEDEPLAAEVLKDYIQQVPFLNLTNHCTDPFYAMEVLQQFPIDLLFLDINLPRMKGLDFIKILKKPPRIIITSAHSEYAISAFEFNVIDYLLKPVEFSRFLMAVNKMESGKDPVLLSNGSATSSERLHLFFTVGKKRVKVFLDEILYIESIKEYVRVISKNKSVLTKFKLSEIEGMLSENNFIRIHRSFIVAKDKIEAFSASEVEIDGKQLPIGRSYRELVNFSLDKI